MVRGTLAKSMQANKWKTNKTKQKKNRYRTQLLANVDIKCYLVNTTYRVSPGLCPRHINVKLRAKACRRRLASPDRVKTRTERIRAGP